MRAVASVLLVLQVLLYGTNNHVEPWARITVKGCNAMLYRGVSRYKIDLTGDCEDSCIESTEVHVLYDGRWFLFANVSHQLKKSVSSQTVGHKVPFIEMEFFPLLTVETGGLQKNFTIRFIQHHAGTHRRAEKFCNFVYLAPPTTTAMLVARLAGKSFALIVYFGAFGVGATIVVVLAILVGTSTLRCITDYRRPRLHIPKYFNDL